MAWFRCAVCQTKAMTLGNSRYISGRDAIGFPIMLMLMISTSGRNESFPYQTCYNSSKLVRIYEAVRTPMTSSLRCCAPS